ncbi:threonine aldolase family protein [Sphingobacterium psychroaquaticum]|uniref:L-threonine aldolase n=1 Tax=Sphingobacterium psychroaquaticum TaxID=561061 RepID=A0A1X7JN43_9SPHI|nr:aminotransferase class I/II-fold pyridoxal phosphate-dependent enzyme [Sphingobacterium psychroaquaticum]SMG29073.1 L-threonine aldolase [Sphingobacterium psychroaquaticum]
MYIFTNDYAEGAHPAILQKMLDTNFEQQTGYGEDQYSIAAKKAIRKEIGNPHASIYFIATGTLTNQLAISCLLKSHEAVISAKSGHIQVHETGAIESLGNRIIPVETTDGKIRPEDIIKICHAHTLRPHVVKPRLVYITNATEIGSIYYKEELIALAACCKENNLLLYMDGARMGNALMATDNDLTLQDMSRLTDAFYIGGTKNGALLGEALIFNDPETYPEFDYLLKQKGALQAKGRLLGIQFLELFTDNLYYELADHANKMAMKIRHAFKEKGYEFLLESTTNQVFPILPNRVSETLRTNYSFLEWAKVDRDKTAVRIVTSWATPESIVDEFIRAIPH